MTEHSKIYHFQKVEVLERHLLLAMEDMTKTVIVTFPPSERIFSEDSSKLVTSIEHT